MLAELKIKERDITTRSHLNQLRDSGYIPSIIYGKDAGNRAALVEQGEFSRFLRQNGRNALLRLKQENGQQLDAIIQDLQVNTLDNKIVHVDFMLINKDEEINTAVPIRLIGTAKGSIEGGILGQELEEVQIRCLPRDVPEFIEIDITELGMDELLRVEDLSFPTGVENRSHSEEVVVRITKPRKQEEESEETEGESGE